MRTMFLGGSRIELKSINNNKSGLIKCYNLFINTVLILLAINYLLMGPK